jgi:hypothetical protein
VWAAMVTTFLRSLFYHLTVSRSTKHLRNRRREAAASTASAWCAPKRCLPRKSCTIWELRNSKSSNL